MTKKPAIPPKKERLTLTQLTDYDDILTDALVDHVCIFHPPLHKLILLGTLWG